MIVYWDDGFEVKCPDSWSDQEAQAFAKRVRAGEVDAAAITEAARLRDAERDANPAVLAELKAIRQAVTADRVLVRDAQGNAIASRVRVPK